MTFEELLIDKQYYKSTFIKGEHLDHPVRVLGEAYVAEHRNEFSDLSYIRYAQGEVYFHNKDYEAAIFKWENIENELEPWAKKNMADAYFELDLYSTAEEIYRSINSDSQILTTEILIKLFFVYKQQGKLEKAVETIKEAVAYNPDYLDLTEMAREFFEEHQDWENAVELSVNEATRTVSSRWFKVIKSYSDEGKTNHFSPNYFSKALVALYIENHELFEQVVASLWQSYKNEKQETYIEWINEINQILINIEDNRNGVWHELSILYKETYSELMNGQLLLKDLSKIIPYHLENWLKVADSNYELSASAAVLSWDEIFPSTIQQEVVQKAERLIVHAKNNVDVLEESLVLFEDILSWAEKQVVHIGYPIKWAVRELLDLRVHHLLITGNDEKSKEGVVQSLIGHSFGTTPSSCVMYRDGDDIEITEINENGLMKIENISEYHEINYKNSMIDFKLPSEFLHENTVTLLDAPSNCWKNSKSGEQFYVHLADAIVVVINPEQYNRSFLLDIQEKVSNSVIQVLISQRDNLYSEEELNLLAEEIHTIFPTANVFINNNSDINGLIQSTIRGIDVEENRTSKMLYFVRTLMAKILEQRSQIEADLNESILWDEEMTTKLGGAIHQLQDMEKEKIQGITKSYLSIKNEIKDEIMKSIPQILKGCSELIKENSDFRKLHIELNEEMNNRIQDYLQKTVLPNFYSSIQNWISFAEEEFYQSKVFLDEMRQGFNTLYGEERLKLYADEKVLDDWRRDAERMKNGIRIDKVNILLRHTPSQVLLKSAGKLFGALQQNKTMLYNKYKKFIENEEYQTVVESIANKFLLQFELFETALERDIAMFFQNPLDELDAAVKKTVKDRQENEILLSNMKANPELFRDPLSLFEVKLRQYEWIIDASKETYPIV